MPFNQGYFAPKAVALWPSLQTQGIADFSVRLNLSLPVANLIRVHPVAWSEARKRQPSDVYQPGWILLARQLSSCDKDRWPLVSRQKSAGRLVLAACSPDLPALFGHTLGAFHAPCGSSLFCFGSAALRVTVSLEILFAKDAKRFLRTLRKCRASALGSMARSLSGAPTKGGANSNRRTTICTRTKSP
jgi:hypothetical protein